MRPCGSGHVTYVIRIFRSVKLRSADWRICVWGSATNPAKVLEELLQTESGTLNIVITIE
jgi:hypothetical protein